MTLSERRRKAKGRVNWYAAGSAGTAVATGPLPGTSFI